MKGLSAAKEKISLAKTRLLVAHPFFGYLVLRREFVYTEEVPTACISSDGVISLNPCFVNALNERNLVFLLAHEVLHYALGHHLRRGDRDALRWNMEADKVINDMLVALGIGEPIPGGVFLEGARHKSVEELYESGEGHSGFGGIGVDLKEDSSGKEIPSYRSAQIKKEISQAIQMAKEAGNFSKEVSRFVEDILEVKTPWFDELERYMENSIVQNRSWKRPKRRFVSSGIYLPDSDKTPSLGSVVLAVDLSGSISGEELKCFASHINRIFETCSPEETYVVYCDSRITQINQFSKDDYPIKFGAEGGGGTAFRPVFDWAGQLDQEPDVLVYFTDGFGDQNDFVSSIPTVWLTTDSCDFNWGSVIKYEG